MRIKHTGIKFRLKVKKAFLNLRHIHLKDLRNLTLTYLKKLPNIVHLKNLVLFNAILAVVMLVMFTSRFSSLAPFYWKTEPAGGGVYREGVIGNVDKINPLFVLNTAEASANRLVFSGLTRTLPNNQVVPDLAKDWTIEQDGSVYTFNLKESLRWHDGQPLTVDDVIFTINLIQNPDTRTPEFTVWKGVKVEKTGDAQLKFTLPTQYPEFLSVASAPILPRHLLESINPKNIKVAEFNKRPIGSGPYKFERFDQGGQDTQIVFTANENFALGKPYISSVRLRTYDNFTDLYNGFIRKQIDGISEVPAVKTNEIHKVSNLNAYQFYLPRYQLLVFNLKNEILKEKEVRLAIEAAINRKEIIDKVFLGQAAPVYAPILPGQVGYSSKFRVDKYNPAQASDILDKAGWVKNNDGVRQKDGKALSLRFVLPEDEETYLIADEIKKELDKVGVTVKLEFSPLDTLQANHIRPRNFDLILVGQEIDHSSDIYSFWHTSQTADPGLNFSGITSRKLDKFIEQARQTNDKKEKAEKNILAQEEILNEVPAVFLYNPIYTMAVTKSVKGFSSGKVNEPVDHLNSIYKWYLREKTKY